MNIRKIAKWYGLKWSNRLEKLLPRFEHDLLVLSNRTVNNSQVAFDDKIRALDNMRSEFENPKYYEGLMRVYATFQLFSRMTECLQEMEYKKLPISEYMRDLVKEFAVVRPVNPENEESARELVREFKRISIHPLPFANEKGEKNVNLQAYIQFHRPCDKEDWVRLSGVLSISEQYHILLDLYDYLKKNNLPMMLEIYERSLRAANLAEMKHKGLEIAIEAFNNNKSLSQTQLNILAKSLGTKDSAILAKHIDIKKYKEPLPSLARFLLQNQAEDKLTSTEVFDAIKNQQENSSFQTDRLSILLEGLASKADVEGAEALWAEFIRMKAFPSNNSYRALMKVYYNAGLPDKVIETWHSNSHRLPTRAYDEIEILLDACSLKGVNCLRDHWEKIKFYDYRLNGNCYNAYIRNLFELGEIEEAIKTFALDLCQLKIVGLEDKTRLFLLTSLQQSDIETSLKDKYVSEVQNSANLLRQAKITPKFR